VGDGLFCTNSKKEEKKRFLSVTGGEDKEIRTTRRCAFHADIRKRGKAFVKEEKGMVKGNDWDPSIFGHDISD